MVETVVVVLLLVAAAAVPRWLLRDLRAVPVGAHSPDRAVSVVVPARDEEDTLPALLHSLARLDTAVSEVVVVDDDSGDATASVARSGGAVVLPAGTPPPGWTGKAWACHVGAQATGGQLL